MKPLLSCQHLSVSFWLWYCVCVLFLFHTARQWLVMVKFSLARSRWREPSVPHVHVWEIYWLPSTHAQSVNSLELRPAVALRSGGRCRCCFNSNLTRVAFELNASFCKREPVGFPTVFFRNLPKLFWGRKQTTTRQITWKVPVTQQCCFMPCLFSLCMETKLLPCPSTGEAVQKSAFQPKGLLVHEANEDIPTQTCFLSVQKHACWTARESADVGFSAAATPLCVPRWPWNLSLSDCSCNGTTDSGTWG